MSPALDGSFPPAFPIPPKPKWLIEEEAAAVGATLHDPLPDPKPAPSLHAPARHTDPEESKEAAAAVKVTKDRLLILAAFKALTRANDGPGVTFHAAAIKATEIEGTSGDYSREESLRRRGSDLRVEKWIEKVGKDGKKSLNRITDAGMRRLHGA